MDATQNATTFDTEQAQRATAVELAGEVLRNHLAGEAGQFRDIIDIASYIVTGVPFTVLHRHQHDQQDPQILDGLAFALNPEDLGGLFPLFERIFAQNDEESTEGENKPSNDDLDNLFD